MSGESQRLAGARFAGKNHNLLSKNDQDRRRANRVTFTMHAPLSTTTGSGVLSENSSTVDVSELGIRLRLHGQIEPGSIVEVFLTKHPEQCRVVWTIPAGVTSKSIAGLEFISPLHQL
jgi:hypothetical protein